MPPVAVAPSDPPEQVIGLPVPTQGAPTYPNPQLYWFPLTTGVNDVPSVDRDLGPVMFERGSHVRMPRGQIVPLPLGIRIRENFNQGYPRPCAG